MIGLKVAAVAFARSETQADNFGGKNIRPGLRWLKAGRYWFAYAATDSGPIVSAVFHESADLPNRV